METDSISELQNKDKFIFYFFTGIIFGISLILVLFLSGVGHNYPLQFTYSNLNWIYLEIVIANLGSILVIQMLYRWLERRNNLTWNLLWLIIMYSAQVWVNVAVKIIKYIVDFDVFTPDTYSYGIVFNFRFTSFFACLAGLFFYSFYVDVFVQKAKNLQRKKWIIVYTVLASICQFLPLFDRISQIIIILIMLIQVIIIYIPVAQNAYQIIHITQWETEERQIYYGFFFVLVLAISFIGIWTFYILSIISDFVTDSSYGIFYQLMQILTFMMLIGIYLGFIMPKWFKNFLDTHQRNKTV